MHKLRPTEKVVFEGVVRLFSDNPLTYDAAISILVYLLAMALHDLNDEESGPLDEEAIDVVVDMLQSAYVHLGQDVTLN